MADEKLSERGELINGSTQDLVHVVHNNASYRQSKENFANDLTRSTTTIRGQKVFFVKHPDNTINLTTFEANDFAETFVFDSTLIATFSQWLGGDQSVDANWDILTFKRLT